MHLFPHAGLRFWLSILSVLIILSACTTASTQIDNTLDSSGVPVWVAMGSKTLKTKTSRLFHGVGAAEESGDMARQTTMADRRAKAELAKILNSFIEIVSRDYTASEKLVNTRFIHQSAANDINSITEGNMPAARIIGHWRDPESEKIYAIAELDMTHVQNHLGSLEMLNKDFRGFLRSQGASIFDRIARRDGE